MSIINDEFELELIHVLFRHGDRTPKVNELFPKDPDKSFDYPPYGYGQLTNAGKQRAFKLGELLKIRYGTFLGSYKPDNVYAYTTWLDRCKTTLQLVLAGLFPPTSELTWNENLKWIPIPFESNPHENELMFFGALLNPRHAELMEKALQSPKIREKTEKYNKVLEYLAEKTGCEQELKSMYKLSRNIQLKQEYGILKPDWCDEKLFKDLKEGQKIFFDLNTHNHEMKKISIGPFLDKVVQNISGNIDKTSNKKIYLYSAHDMTVLGFLKAHNINHINPINYCGTVILEKLRRKKDDKQFVRLFYWPGDGEKFHTFKFEDCDEMCPLEKYFEIVKPLLSSDSVTLNS